jgi:formylglycine-generating enzyme required for sulfatase activity
MSSIRFSVVLGLFAVGCVADPATEKVSDDDVQTDADLDDSQNTSPVGELAAGMQLTDVVAGAFSMGSPETEANRYDDEALRTVELTGNVEIAVTEVTQKQFREYMGYDAPDMFVGCDDCPVQNVSWDEAASFANSLSITHELETCYVCDGAGTEVECNSVSDIYSCTGYRLPTEAEWEYAALAGQETVYAGSDDLEEYGWYYFNSQHEIHTVAELRPNSWGIYDMSGNVRELVHDWYVEDLAGDFVVDPVVQPSEGARPVERGGSFDCIPDHLRVETRIMHINSDLTHDADRDREDWERTDDDAPGEIGSRVRDVHVGFRVARSIFN